MTVQHKVFALTTASLALALCCALFHPQNATARERIVVGTRIVGPGVTHYQMHQVQSRHAFGAPIIAGTLYPHITYTTHTSGPVYVTDRHPGYHPYRPAPRPYYVPGRVPPPPPPRDHHDYRYPSHAPYPYGPRPYSNPGEHYRADAYKEVRIPRSQFSIPRPPDNYREVRIPKEHDPRRYREVRIPR